MVSFQYAEHDKLDCQNALQPSDAALGFVDEMI
jgi:hypothetical protein